MSSQKEKPIIFSADMLQAILENRKSQTRRVIKPQPTFLAEKELWKCPYGKVGDKKQLYEEKMCSYKKSPKALVAFKVDDAFIEITDIRVERLQEISEKDCLKEGIKTVKFNCQTCNGSGWNYTYPDGCPDCKKTGIYNKPYFKDLWNSLAKKGFKWEDSPWVWVICFKKVGV